MFFFSCEVHIERHLFNERDTKKMYRICQAPSSPGFLGTDNIFSTDHSLRLPASFLYLTVLWGIINERAGGTRHKNNEKHSKKKKKNYNQALQKYNNIY